MLRLCKPKFFMPIHGEYNHAVKHQQTGIDCGVLERNTYIMSDGEQVEVTPKMAQKFMNIYLRKDMNTQKLIDKKISRKEVFVKTFNDLMQGIPTTGLKAGDIR